MKSFSLVYPRIVARLALVLLAWVLSCTPLQTGTVFSPPGTTTTIIMVRDAERNEGLDPPLNEEGLIRAEALADELEDGGVTAVSYPNFIRNRQTADPLAERSGATRREYGTLEVGDTKALANNFVAEVLRNQAGGAVVWIGNTGPFIEGVQSGNLQEIYARLGGTGDPPTKYKSLYTIVLHDDLPPTITEDTFGGTSSLDRDLRLLLPNRQITRQSPRLLILLLHHRLESAIANAMRINPPGNPGL